MKSSELSQDERTVPENVRLLCNAVIRLYSRIRTDGERPLRERVFQDTKDGGRFMQAFYKDNYDYPTFVNILQRSSHLDAIEVTKMAQEYLRGRK